MVPSQFRAGTTVQWSTALIDDYADYALRTVFANADAQFEVLVATAGVTGWDSELSSVETGALAVGTYTWVAYVEQGATRIEIGCGQTEILPSPLAGAVDLRSDAQKALDAIDAVLAGRAGKDHLMTIFKDRQVMRETEEQLQKRRSYWFWRVRQEQGGSGVVRSRLLR